MIEIEEALKLVETHGFALPAIPVSLNQLAGHILAEDVYSDVDSPPFDKSMMDGFAVRASDITASETLLDIVARVNAGAEFGGAVQPGQAVQIMTGAPIPSGADSVVMVEQTTSEGEKVTVQALVNHGQNILQRGIAMKAGQPVMNSGDLVRGEDIGLLAEAGAATCNAIPRPTLAVIATGDELVDAAETPSGSQIRNSNGPMIASLARPFCRTVVDLGIGPDEPEKLAASIRDGLQQDVLVLSGGVSAGVADMWIGERTERNEPACWSSSSIGSKPRRWASANA